MASRMNGSSHTLHIITHLEQADPIREIPLMNFLLVQIYNKSDIILFPDSLFNYPLQHSLFFTNITQKARVENQ
jgi:hypothetical protein